MLPFSCPGAMHEWFGSISWILFSGGYFYIISHTITRAGSGDVPRADAAPKSYDKPKFLNPTKGSPLIQHHVRMSDNVLYATFFSARVIGANKLTLTGAIIL